MSHNVIVIGSNPATKLSLIRCVGAIEGSRVTVVSMVSGLSEKSQRSYDTYSKYVDNYFYAKKYDAEGLANLLLEKCRIEGEKPIILSVDDDSACLIDTIQDQIRDYFVFSHIGNNPGAIAGLMDKSKQKLLAKEFGFCVAESWILDYIDGKYRVPEGIKYPCYVKGLHSYHTAKRYQKKCSSEQELKECLEVMAREVPYPMLAEEFLEIDKEYGVIGYSNAERVILPGVVELMDCGYGNDRGVAPYGRVNDFGLNEALKPKIEQLMKHIQLSGLFNIDFVESKGRWYFVEVNLRYAAYGYAVCKAGVNLPAFLIYNALSKDDSVLSTQVRNGIRYVNEKVAFDDVLGGYRSLKEYRRIIKNADCRLIRQDDDPQPWCQFRNRSIKTYIKKRITKKINHN